MPLTISYRLLQTQLCNKLLTTATRGDTETTHHHYLGGTENRSGVRLAVVTNHATTGLMHSDQLHMAQLSTLTTLDTQVHSVTYHNLTV